jgi:hypothetical protein
MHEKSESKIGQHDRQDRVVQPKKLAKRKGKGILKIEGYVFEPYVALVSSTFWNFRGAAWACAACGWQVL